MRTTVITTPRHQNSAFALRIAAAVAAAAVLLAIVLPSSAQARSTRHVTWAPHIDRQIVPRKATSHGKQIATWYGPGFFGNRTACGQTLKRSTWGIAHRTLPCGTLVTLKHRGKQVTVPVIDRGPYSGATVDLTSRTKSYLRFVSGSVKMSQVRRFRVLPKSGIRQVGTFRSRD